MAEPYDFKGKKQIKDAHAAREAQSYAVLFGFFLTLLFLGGMIGMAVGGKQGGLIGCFGGALVSLLAGRLWRALTEGIADNVGRIVFIGKKANWTKYERLESDMQQIRYAKHSERYGEALTMVNRVLKKAPEWPEALLLKADILWEGFESLEESKEVLRTIIKLTEPSDKYHVWARSKYKELSQYRKESSS